MDFNEVIETARRFAGGKQKEKEKKKKEGSENYDDLLIDRLHNRYTVALLVCFCIALSTYEYIGNPIHCWVPAQLAENYETYISRLCYIQNTYYVSKQQSIPQDSNIRRERTVKYYQWINFVLLLQAFFFFLPRFIWQSCSDKLGLSVQNLVEASDRCHVFNTEEDRNEIIQYISDSLQRYEEYINPSKRENSWRSFYQGRTGASLACFYIFIKLLYIINIIFQIIFLQYFLSYHDVRYFQYGLDVFNKFLFNSLALPESQLFPRMTLCDFQIRELGERHFYTVECVLVINIFIEKMYFLLWIWFGVLLVLTIGDTIWLLYRLFLRHSRNVFIKNNLELIIESHLTREKQFAYFLRYFPIDNLLTLRMIAANSSSLIVAEILQELFQRKLHHESDV